MRDPRIKRSCPFCGEAVHLSFSAKGGLMPMVVSGAVVEDENGYEKLDEVDAVYCDVCGGNAPLVVWNCEVPADIMAALRDFDRPVQEIAA